MKPRRMKRRTMRYNAGVHPFNLINEFNGPNLINEFNGPNLINEFNGPAPNLINEFNGPNQIYLPRAPTHTPIHLPRAPTHTPVRSPAHTNPPISSIVRFDNITQSTTVNMRLYSITHRPNKKIYHGRIISNGAETQNINIDMTTDRTGTATINGRMVVLHRK